MYLLKYFCIIAIIFTGTWGLSGCTSFVASGRQFEIVQNNYPELNTETTVYRGEDMLVQGAVLEEDVLVLKSPILSFGVDFPAGSYPVIGKDVESYYLATKTFEGVSISVNPLADPVKGLKFYKDSKELCTVSIFNAPSCYDSDGYITKMRTAAVNQNQKTIKYASFKNNIARFVYIEIDGKSGSTREIEFEHDLSEGSIVNYGGAVIEIVKATPNQITYKVMRSFREIDSVVRNSKVNFN